MADWGDGVSARLSVNACNGWPHNALWHHWLMPAATSKIVISASGHESDSCKWRYSKCPDLTFSPLPFYLINPGLIKWIKAVITVG